MLTTLTSTWSEHVVWAMGSPGHVIVGGGPGELGSWVHTELERLEQCWSRFRPGSELSRLHAAGGTPFTMSPTLATAVTAALTLHDATGGRFDPTVLDALEACGYDRPYRELRELGDRGPRPTPSAVPGVSGIAVDGPTIRLPAGVRLDLGGLGKGLAADIVAEGLVQRGADSALVCLGGDIRVAGVCPQGGWRIPVEDPTREGRTLLERDVTSGAIVTSTTMFRTWRRDGEVLHHLIDPATGEPARSPVCAVVAMAPSAWWAEGVAKAALVAGPADGRLLMRRNGVGGWMVDRRGRVDPVRARRRW